MKKSIAANLMYCYCHHDVKGNAFLHLLDSIAFYIMMAVTVHQVGSNAFLHFEA